MASKKPAAARKAAAAKSAKLDTAKLETTTPETTTPATTMASKWRVWTLPLAMLMLIVGAGGLWLALHESSNAPEAASHDVVMATEPAPAKTHTPAPAPAASAAPAAPAPDETARPAAPRSVSITGCLQQAGGAFVLKNAEGADAPKSRSWKSGFLHKSTPSISLVDAGNAAHFGSHVGQRVSVTGPLVEHEMRVQSLHRVAASCQ